MIRVTVLYPNTPGAKFDHEYFAGKMSTIRNSPKAQVFAELGETTQYPMYTVPEQPCVILAQGTKDNILAVVLFETKDTKITRIDICSVVPAPQAVGGARIARSMSRCTVVFFNTSRLSCNLRPRHKPSSTFATPRSLK